LTRIVALCLLLVSSQAVPRPAEPERVELLPGVAFEGDGGVGQERGPDGLVVATFWRPVRFGTEGEPIGGRMDCRAAARRDPFSLALFELEATHAGEASRLESERWSEIERSKDYRPDVRVLDVVMRRSNPARYGVMTYIAARTDDDVVSIRRLCTFIRGNGAWRPDYRAMIHRYTAFALDLSPPNSTDPLVTPTLENLIATEN
jgi:hypothetical protein